MQQSLHHVRAHPSQSNHPNLHFILHMFVSTLRFRASGNQSTSALLLDANFIVVPFPAIATGPEERKYHRANLIVLYSDINEVNSDSS
jgi:hypothetical protein